MTAVQKRLLGALAVLVLLGGIWKLLLEPAAQDRSAAQEELASAQSAEAEAQTALAAARTAEGQVDENRRALVTLSRVVPSQPETSALLDRLDDLARRSGVGFDSINLDGTGTDDAGTSTTPSAATTTGGATAGGATEVPVSLKLSGSFPRVTALLRRLHGRGADLGGGRLLKLSAVKLADDADAEDDAPEGALTADITAVAFVLPAEAAAAAGAADGTATTGSADAAASGTSTATAPGGTG